MLSSHERFFSKCWETSASMPSAEIMLQTMSIYLLTSHSHNYAIGTPFFACFTINKPPANGSNPIYHRLVTECSFVHETSLSQKQDTLSCSSV